MRLNSKSLLLPLVVVLVACNAVEPGEEPNPVPVLLSAVPSMLRRGEDPVDVELSGEGFVEGAVVTWNGDARATTVVGPTSVTLDVSLSDVATVGDVQVAVINPEPGGGTSNSLDVTVGNPIPVLDSISPNTVEAVATTGFTLEVFGSGFTAGPGGSTVRWNDIALSTDVVSPTELKAEVGDYLVRHSEAAHITVSNPAPGGGVSAPVDFGWLNPIPGIQGVDPPHVTVGTDDAFSITGTGFVDGSMVIYGTEVLEPKSTGVDVLTFDAPGSEHVSGQPVALKIQNPAPGGGTSNQIDVPVWEKPPRVDGFSPPSVPAGTPPFTLVASGAQFWPSATVTWGGVAHAATVVDSTRIDIPVDVSDVAVEGPVDITISNPTAGGDVSGTFIVAAPVPPELDSISPHWIYAGSPSFTLSILGESFSAGATVTWDGAPHAVSLVDGGHLEITVDAADVATEGVVQVVVSNPNAPGAASAAFYVLEPLPYGARVVMETAPDTAVVLAALDGSGRIELQKQAGASMLDTPPVGIDVSPIDRMVVYSGNDGSSNQVLYETDFGTGTTRRLASAADDVLFIQGAPRYSYDGQWIYFEGCEVCLGLDFEIWRARPDGSGAGRLVYRYLASYGLVSPASTSDTLVIAPGLEGSFRSFRTGNLALLDPATLDGSEYAGQATPLGVVGATSRWSPDDEWIAYLDESSELNVIRSDGSERHKILGVPVGLSFDWSPDGQYIVAVAYDGDPVIITVAPGKMDPLPALGQVSSIAWYDDP